MLKDWVTPIIVVGGVLLLFVIAGSAERLPTEIRDRVEMAGGY